jgi:hypothetical protein
VLAGLRGDRQMRDVCRDYESARVVYQWRERLLEGGKAALDTSRDKSDLGGGLVSGSPFLNVGLLGRRASADDLFHDPKSTRDHPTRARPEVRVGDHHPKPGGATRDTTC